MGYRDVYEYNPVYSVYPGFLGMGKVAKADRQEWKVYIDQLQALDSQLRKGSVPPDQAEPAQPAVEGSNAQESKARNILQRIVTARQIAGNLAAAALARSSTSAYAGGTIPPAYDWGTPAPPGSSGAPSGGTFVDPTVPDPAAAGAPGVPSPVSVPGTIPSSYVNVSAGMPAGYAQDIARAQVIMDPTEQAVVAPPSSRGKWIAGAVAVAAVAAIFFLRKRRKNPRRRAGRRRRR